MTVFRRRVIAAVRRIPAGRVATYGDIAGLAGQPRAARAVGNIMRDCGEPGVPCHRVIGAAGALGGYGGSVQLKRELLRAEGVQVGLNRIVSFARVRWTGASHTNTKTGSKSSPRSLAIGGRAACSSLSRPPC